MACEERGAGFAGGAGDHEHVTCAPLVRVGGASRQELRDVVVFDEHRDGFARRGHADGGEHELTDPYQRKLQIYT